MYLACFIQLFAAISRSDVFLAAPDFLPGHHPLPDTFGTSPQTGAALSMPVYQLNRLHHSDLLGSGTWI